MTPDVMCLLASVHLRPARESLSGACTRAVAAQPIQRRLAYQALAGAGKFCRSRGL
jgi:hypothetical protein